jgi:polysaccharide biosynthesis transport protein
MKNPNALRKKDETFDIESYYLNDTDMVAPDGYYGASNKGNEKQQIFKILGTLRKYWLIIVSLNLIITFLVIIYVAQRADFYQAEARVQVNSETNPAAGVKGGSSVIVNPGNDPAYFTTQLQILEGAGLLRRVVKNLDLEHNEAFLSPNKGRELTVWQNVLRMFNLYKQPARSKDENLVKNTLNLKDEARLDPDKEAEKLAPFVGMIKRGLTISPVKDTRTSVRETRLIEIKYIHQDPNVAAKVVNTIADIYVLQNLEQKVQTNAAAGDFLQKRVAELTSQIRSGEERLLNYSQKNDLISLDASQNTVVQRLSSLNGALGEAENERIAAESAYRAAMQNPMLKEGAQSADPQTGGIQSQLVTLRQKLTQLLTEYTEEWWEVKQTRKQIESLEKELNASRKIAVDTQVAKLEQTYREAAARERELRINFDKQRREVVEQNQAAINYKIIQQEIETNKSLLDGLLQRSRENDVILNGTPNNVLVADRALVPRGAIASDKFKDVFIAFGASLLLGIGLAFLLDWLNDNIKHSDDIEEQFNLPLLAMIPIASSGLGKKLLPGKFALTKTNGRAGKYDLDSFDKPAVAECYLQLRTYLLLSTPGGPPQKILVTSGQPGEGKTVTALNLAKTLSQTGVNVLLIDGDLRYPRLHNVFKAENHRGLSNLLTMKDLNEQAIAETVQKIPGTNLHLLTAGLSTPAPANLLGSNEMRNFLTIAGKQYSHIVIDSPPVLYFADSIILSTLADAVVIVARDNVSTKQAIQRTKKMLHDVGAKIIGMVLNGIPQRSSSYYKYDYYEAAEEPYAESNQGIFKLN